MSGPRRLLAPPPVSLAPLAGTHAEALAAQLADPRVWSMLHDGEPSTAGAAGAVAREQLGAQRGLRRPFAIHHGDVVVGLCGLSRQMKPLRERDVYYWIGAAHQGRGIATRAVALLLDVALLDDEVTRLTSLVLVRNGASRRVLERNGFQLERTFTASAAALPSFAGEPAWELARALDPAPSPAR